MQFVGCVVIVLRLSHILAGCTWVRIVENKLPREDRYTRHNNILLLLAKAISEQIKLSNASRLGSRESKSQSAKCADSICPFWGKDRELSAKRRDHLC
jgi:hypothetical protein